MADLADLLRTRIVPALLVALGVTLLAGGLLSYTSAANPAPGPSPSIAGAPSTRVPLITFPPQASGDQPTASASLGVDRLATRIRIAALKIDLPVIEPEGDASTYPLCNVAMFLQELGQPGQGRAIYLYAHARPGMFLPLLEASLVDNGDRMLGIVVEVWTSDDQRFLYVVTEVRPHQTDLDGATRATSEELWLQTSEGPKGTPGKLQVIAIPISQEAADPVDAHPLPKPVVCG